MEKTKDSHPQAQEIKTQMEYYLSDENLKKDTFFHEKISSDPNGYIDLDLFLKCNKIIKSKWTKEDLISGIKLSSEIELNDNSSKVRRKDNPPLPELTMLNKKRKKDAKEEDDEDGDNKDKADMNADPVILLVTSPKDVATKWKDIIQEFKDTNSSLNVIYGRFKGNEGHIGIVISSPDDELKFSPTFEVDGTQFAVQKCEDEKLIDFWKNHGSHYELCVKTKKETKGKKKKKANTTYLDTAVQLGGESYSDLSMIRAKSRAILNNSKDGDPLNEKDNSFILDVLKYHHNYDDKTKNMDYITTGIPEKYTFSRCYFIVNKDKTQTDFSIQKCFDIIEVKYKK